MKIEYKISWKVPKFKASAKEAYAEISKLEKITPERVVDVARDEKSAIHNDFEWNDTVAGEKYRKIQAGEMIRLLVFEPIEEELQPVRTFQITTKRNVYQQSEIIIRQENEYQNLLQRALRELEAIKRRYQTLTELEPIFEAMEEIL